MMYHTNIQRVGSCLVKLINECIININNNFNDDEG
jgi:hypothetical protein